jgi:hypothetical protein
MQFHAQSKIDIDAYDDAVRQHRIIVMEGNIGEPTPAFPASLTLTLPEVVPTGAFRRLIEGRDRIIVHSTYTDEAGAALGMLASTPGPTPESELKPTVTVYDSFSDFKFNVNVSRKKNRTPLKYRSNAPAKRPGPTSPSQPETPAK